MKVLHVIPSIAPRYGGPSQALIDLGRALLRQDVDVEICTTDADGPTRLAVALGTPTTYEGLPCHFFPRQATEAFKYSRPLAQWLDQNVARFNLVHIHAVFSHATYAAARACQRRGIPYIVRPLGTLEPWSMQQKRPRKLVSWHLFFKRVMQGAAAVHYTTDQERDLTEQSLGLTRSVVVANGVPDGIFEPVRTANFRGQTGLPAEAPFVLALSRIHPKKGIDVLLRAFVDLKAAGQIDSWHLVIAGDGEPGYVAELRKSIQEPAVHWTGWLKGDPKREALTEAGLFALTSYQENFGIGVAEALACGTPVLVSRPVGLASQIDAAGAGWVVEMEQAAVRAGLLAALQDRMTLKTRGAAAKTLAREEFSWTKIAERWRANYEKMARC